MRDVAPVQITAATPVGDAAIALVGERMRRIFELESAAASGTDVEAVHDMRVASRRTREAFALFAHLYRRSARTTIARAARDVTRALGPLRDADIFCDRFTFLAGRATDPAEKVALSYLVGYRQARREADVEQVRDRLAHIGLKARRKRMLHALHEFRRTAALEAPLRDLAQSAISQRLERFWAYLPAALQPDEAAEQHAMRIAAKRLRYAIETLAPCFEPDAAAEALQRIKEFQDVLGELHDRNVFTAALAGVAESGDAQAAGVSAEGLDAVTRDLAAERADLFASFENLVANTPAAEFSATLLRALMPPQEV